MTEDQHVNREAEMVVLGSALIEADTVMTVDFPSPDDFKYWAHRHIAQAIWDKEENGDPIDPITVSDLLEKRGVLHEVGGRGYVSELVSSVTTTTSVGYYASIVSRDARLRRLDQAALELRDMVYQSEPDPDEITSEAMALLENVSDGRASDDVGTDEVIESVIQEYDDLQQGKLPGIPTGFSEFDRRLGGIPKNNVNLIVGRTSEGKTVFAKSVGLKQAMRGINVGYILNEMTKEQIAGRMMQELGGFSRYEARQGEAGDKIEQAKENFPVSNFHFREPGYDVQDVIRAMQELHVRKGCEVIYIDLFNKITTKAYSDSKPAMHSYVLRSLEAARDRIAKRTGRPLALMVVCQINRQATKSDSGKPRLEHIKETGSLEEDACLVLGVYRPHRWGENDDRTDMRLLLMKAQSESIETSQEEFQLYFDEPRQIVRDAGTPF